MGTSTDPLDQRLTLFLDFCQKQGFKATPQRLEIFRQVAQTCEHPSADVICSRVREVMPTVSADTVYRTLTFLEAHGLIQKVNRLHGSARFDANLRRHHHFVCSNCGGIWDVYSDEFSSLTPPSEVSRLGTITMVHVELYGICRACQTSVIEAVEE